MGLVELLILLVIAGICGVIAEWVVGFSPGGFVVSIVVGLIGAYLGSWLAGVLGLPPVLSVVVWTTQVVLWGWVFPAGLRRDTGPEVGPDVGTPRS